MGMVGKKIGLAKKILQVEGNMQGSKKVPMKQTKEYGTGAPFKKPPMKKMASKKK